MTTADFKTTTLNSYSKTYPGSVRLGDGRIVMTWTSRDEDGDGNGVYMRILDEYGRTDAAPVLVNTVTVDNQQEPQIAALAGGGFVIVWGSGALESYSVQAQRFDVDGQPVGGVIEVAPSVTYPRHIDVSATQDGGFMVNYPVYDGSSRVDMFVKIFNAFGGTSGTAIQISDSLGESVQGGRSIALEDGSFLVAYVTGNPYFNVLVQHLSASGELLGPALNPAGSSATDVNTEPELTLMADGRALLVWQTGFSSDGAKGRFINPDGSFDGGAFTFAAEGSGRWETTATALDDGGFVLVWTEYVPGTVQTVIVYSQIYDDDANAVGPQMQALSNIGSITGTPDVVALSGGGFLVTMPYDGDGPTGGYVFNLISSVDGQATPMDDVLSLHTSGVLSGKAGNDILFGSAGDDVLLGKAGLDVIYGGAGRDVIRMGALDNLGVEVAYGGAGSDQIIDRAGISKLYGGDGDDILKSGTENDTVDGGAGDDSLFGGDHDDRLTGGEGRDKLLGGDGEDLLFGGNGIDTLFGGAGEDTTYGGVGSDALYGDEDDDVMMGGAGKDKFYGGSGDDIFTGGEGADQFMFVDSDFGDDVIVDWDDGRDRFMIKTSVASTVSLDYSGESVVVSFGGGTVTVLGASAHFDIADIEFY